jgi:hypothetical protein
MKPASRRNKKKKNGKQKQQRKADRRDEQRSRLDDESALPERKVDEVTPQSMHIASPSSIPLPDGTNEQQQPDAAVVVKMWKCNSCAGSSFATAAEHRAHFKTDWHRFNQKLTIKGAKTVTEQEFKSCDIDSLFRDDDYNA